MSGPFGLGVIVTSLMAANIASLTRARERVSMSSRFGGTILAGGGGGGGAGAACGYNVGVGLLARASPTFGARIDYTHHRLAGGGGTLPFSSISIGFVWMR